MNLSTEPLNLIVLSIYYLSNYSCVQKIIWRNYLPIAWHLFTTIFNDTYFSAFSVKT